MDWSVIVVARCCALQETEANRQPSQQRRMSANLALVGESTTFNVVYLAQNEAYKEDLLYNEMVQQTSWQAIYIFVTKTLQHGILICL